MKQAFVYILASQTRGTLYIGVTSDLTRRVAEHRSGDVPGFTATHGVKRLVHIAECTGMATAMAREKQLKRWHRAWKIALIEETNPAWRDLAIDLGFAPLRPKLPQPAARMDPETSAG
jgi:putative endonuclease